MFHSTLLSLVWWFIMFYVYDTTTLLHPLRPSCLPPLSQGTSMNFVVSCWPLICLHKFYEALYSCKYYKFMPLYSKGIREGLLIKSCRIVTVWFTTACRIILQKAFYKNRYENAIMGRGLGPVFYCSYWRCISSSRILIVSCTVPTYLFV